MFLYLTVIMKRFNEFFIFKVSVVQPYPMCLNNNNNNLYYIIYTICVIQNFCEFPSVDKSDDSSFSLT